MTRFFVAFMVLSGWAPVSASAQDIEKPSALELGRVFRALLLPNLPDPLVAQTYNWDHQDVVTVGVKWEKNGLLLRPEPMKALRNNGKWRRIAVTADHPDKTLDLRIKDVKMPEPGRLTFTMQLQLPVHLKFEQQFWRSGIRLYSGETRARCNATLQLQCESTSRFDKKEGSLFPELVMRLRVAEAKLTYSQFVVEHTVGVGGDLAKRFGDAIHETITALRPSLERDLLAKANTAIVKAGDTKEVRLNLNKLFDGK